MKTGSFRTYDGPGRISIARYARGTKAGFRLYPKLAPGPWFKTATKEEYTRLFFDQLEALDPQEVIADLGKLAEGHEPVLMCWEVPPFTDSNWCHRRMVAEWLADKAGLDVLELDIEPTASAAEPSQARKPAQQVVRNIGGVQLEALREGTWEDVCSKDAPAPLVFASRAFATAAIARIDDLTQRGRYAGLPLRVKA